LARGIVASPTALNHARAENWREAVKTIHADCIPLGRTLIAEHDRLFGAGTGERFVAGPYAADLPRALKARIGSEIARRAEEPVTAQEVPASATAPETEAGVQPPALSSPPQDPMRGSVAIGPEAAHDEDLNTPGTVRLRPGIGAHHDEFRAAAVSATPSADEVRPDRPAVPSSSWLVYVAALTAGVYAVMRAPAMAYKPSSLSV
jgi:hypothetical protein